MSEDINSLFWSKEVFNGAKIREYAKKEGVNPMDFENKYKTSPILLSVTIIGFPVALIMGMLFIIALMLSSLFVSFAVGRKIVDLFKFKTHDILIFVLGFIILSLLFRIPYAGVLIGIVAISLGFGAIVYALRKNWQSITTSFA